MMTQIYKKQESTNPKWGVVNLRVNLLGKAEKWEKISLNGNQRDLFPRSLGVSAQKGEEDILPNMYKIVNKLR